MGRNSSTSNFRWPKAFLLALSLWLAVNLAVWLMVMGHLVDPARSNGNLEQMTRAESESGHFVVLGNSTATRLDLDILRNEIPVPAEKKILSLAARGSVPRTQQFFLERSDYRCVETGGTALIFISPMDLNRNNQSFHWTVRDLFSWREFFTELLFQGRFLEATYFLQRATMPLVKYQSALNDFFIHFVRSSLPETTEESPAINRNKVDEQKVRDSVAAYRERYLADYTIDPYELASVSTVLRGLGQKDVRAVIVLPPFSAILRALMRPEDLKLYAEAVHDLARRHRVRLLDYVSDHDGTEYTFYDASHLTDVSVGIFSKLLAKDLK